MSAYRLENPLRLIRELKGVPLAVILALQIARQRVTKSWLEQVTGYTDKPVAGALSYLSEVGYVDHTVSGWQLTGSFIQLPIPLQLAPENETRNDSVLQVLPDSPGRIESVLDASLGRNDPDPQDMQNAPGRNESVLDASLGRNDPDPQDMQNPLGRNESGSQVLQDATDRNISGSDDTDDEHARNDSDPDDSEDEPGRNLSVSPDWEKLLRMLEEQYRGSTWDEYFSAMQLARVEHAQAVIHVPSQEQRDWLDWRCKALLERAFGGFPDLTGREAVFVVAEAPEDEQGRNNSDPDLEIKETDSQGLMINSVCLTDSQNQIINSVCLTDSQTQPGSGNFPTPPGTPDIRQILDAAEDLFDAPIAGEPDLYADRRTLLSWIAQAFNTWETRGGATRQPASLVYWAINVGKLPDKKYTRNHHRWLPESFWRACGLWPKNND
jgi:hypothetical protein